MEQCGAYDDYDDYYTYDYNFEASWRVRWGK
jgi:hypothetical protein